MAGLFYEPASGGGNVGLVLELIALLFHWKSWCSPGVKERRAGRVVKENVFCKIFLLDQLA